MPVVHGVAVPGIGVDNFSARFTSVQNITPGDYNFIVSSDDGVRLYINGALVLDKFIARALTTDTVSVSIITTPVNVTVEYFEGVDQAILQVQWFLTSGNPPASATPTPSVPTRNYFADHTISLSWNRISWAVGYEIQIATDNQFDGIYWSDNTLSEGTLSVTTPYLSNGQYYWRVRAKVNAVEWGDWSVTSEFMIYAQDFGADWTGTFFPSNNLTGTGVVVSNIQGLNFNWGTGVPVVDGVAVPGIPSDNFSARFTSVQVLGSGRYTFMAASDDGIRVYIDDALFLDKFIERPLTTDTFTVDLPVGSHTFVIEYFDNIDQAILQFQWAFDG